MEDRYQPRMPNEAERIEKQKAQLRELEMALARKQNVNSAPMDYREQPADHLSVSAMVNYLGDEARKLLEEATLLRERLSPLLAQRETIDAAKSAPIMGCKLTEELAEVHQLIRNTSECINHTLAQLDL